MMIARLTPTADEVEELSKRKILIYLIIVKIVTKNSITLNI